MKSNIKILIAVFILFYQAAQAATITVCSSGCDHTTISAAVAAATSGDIIDIQYTGTAYTEDAITIDKDLTIQGQGQTSTIIQAAATQAAADDAVFIINVGLTVTIQDLTIQNGNALGSGTSNLKTGGGIYANCNNSTTINFMNLVITNCRADDDDGGGVFLNGSNGTVTFTNCIITNNEANTSDNSSFGGGINNSGAKFFTLDRCTISGNLAGSSGAGVSIFEANSSNKFINCTIYNNVVGGTNGFGAGGGIYILASSCEIINCTIVNNSITQGSAKDGAGVYHRSGSLHFTNTIVANNTIPSGINDVTASADGITITQTTSLVEVCDDDDGTCATFSYSSDANIATTASFCAGSQHAYFDITGSDAQDNGTAPSGDIPTTDICGWLKVAAHDIGSRDMSSVLPVELIDFKGKLMNEAILLQWKTAIEIDNFGFEIERSVDGKQWEIIDFVQGNGTTQAIQDYSLLDPTPFIGKNYYRLKQIDYDGQYEYSDIINITIESYNHKNIQIYPNPVTNQFNIRNTENVVNVAIYNTLGQLMQQHAVEPQSTNLLTINTQSLPNNTYILQLQKQNGSIESQRFIKN